MPFRSSSSSSTTTTTGRVTPDTDSEAVFFQHPESDEAKFLRLIRAVVEVGLRGTSTSHRSEQPTTTSRGEPGYPFNECPGSSNPSAISSHTARCILHAATRETREKEHCQCVDEIKAVIHNGVKQFEELLVASLSLQQAPRSEAAAPGDDEKRASCTLSEDEILSRVTDALDGWDYLHSRKEEKAATRRESASAESPTDEKKGKFWPQWENLKKRENKRFEFAVRRAVALARDRGPVNSPVADDKTVVGPGSPGACAGRPVLPPSAKKGAIPCPGKTLILTDVKFEYALSLYDGELKFVELEAVGISGKGGCYLWHCVEDNGWLGFRNAASGTYMGHDGNTELCAAVKYHHPYERFCLRQVEGGYVLLILYGQKLTKIGLDGEWGKAKLPVLTTQGDPMIWQFIEV